MFLLAVAMCCAYSHIAQIQNSNAFALTFDLFSHFSYYPDFLHSVFHCKHQINVLTSGKVYLADILHNDTAIFYFMEVRF